MITYALNQSNHPSTDKSLKNRKMRALRNLRMIPEYLDDPAIDAYALEQLATLELDETNSK